MSTALRDALQDMLSAAEQRPPCQAGYVARCVCRACAMARARAALAAATGAQPQRLLLTDADIVSGFADSEIQPQLQRAFDLFEAGARFAERAHGIGAQEQP